MDLRWRWRINILGGRKSRISTFAATTHSPTSWGPVAPIDIHVNCMQFISYNATCYRPYTKTGPLLCIELPFPHRLYLYACPMEDPNFHPSQWWEFRLSTTTSSTSPTPTTTTITTPKTTTTTTPHTTTPKPTTKTTIFAKNSTTTTTDSNSNPTISSTTKTDTGKLNLENLFGPFIILVALLIFCCIRMERRAKKRQQQQQQPRHVFMPSRRPFQPAQQFGAEIVPLAEISDMFALDEENGWDDDCPAPQQQQQPIPQPIEMEDKPEGPAPQQQQQPIPQPIEMEDMPEEEEERRVRFADRESIYYSMPDLAERELPPIPTGEVEEEQAISTTEEEEEQQTAD